MESSTLIVRKFKRSKNSDKLYNLCFNIIYIYILSFLFFPNQANCQPRSNYFIMDSLALNLTNNILVDCILSKYKSINFKITDLPQSGIIKKHLANLCGGNEVLINNDTTNSITHDIQINRFDVSYTNHDDNDSIIRNFKIDVLISGEKTLYQNFRTYNFEYTENVLRDDVPFIETSSRDFTKPPLPPIKKTFFEQAVEPFILVSSAILTVIILFSVRSN